mmetsp:Transcript_15226/g.20785  ORF Transcript_15226/g.20785 Transcript_15226/m.20785 type:complete len:304 (-) Transcript_15226:55-966(-)
MASKPGLAFTSGIDELPKVVDSADQPCQELYEGNPVLLGYDVVQYHFIKPFREGGEAVQGKPEHAYNFNGYQFWFSTDENRELFKADPWKYAPAWGGFCSWGIALELQPKWPWEEDFLGPPASPWEGWLIVDGVLMFNIWDNYSQRFLNDGEKGLKNAHLAAERWKKWWGSLHAGPFNTHCIGHGPLKNWCLSQQPAPWLEELSCGNIVSEKDDFEEFSNDSLSPYQKNRNTGLIIGGSVFIALLLGFATFFLCKRKRRAAQTPTDQKHANSANNTNSDASNDESFQVSTFQDEPVDVAVAVK